jgi:hypothetical protein
MTMRAVAIVRTSSSGSSSGARRAVLDPGQQVDRDALRMRVERRQLLQHAAAGPARSPMPMMPPLQTVMPALRTRDRLEALGIGAVDDAAVKLG